MESESLNRDLDDSHCAVTTCLGVADVVGQARVRLPATVGAVEAEERLTLDVPLCVEHAHLLRQGVDEFDFDSRLQ